MKTVHVHILDAPAMEIAGSASPTIEEWENSPHVCSLSRRKEPGTGLFLNWLKTGKGNEYYSIPASVCITCYGIRWT
jgi:hypothetical protein